MIVLKRAIFISIASVTAATLVAGVLITLKKVDDSKIGNITEVFEVEGEYIYGQGFVTKGSAYKSDVTFEYSEVEKDDWTEAQPKYVGSYKLRAKAKDVNGNYKYSAEQTFDIVPKEISAYVNQQYIKYGESHPSIFVGTLPGDTYNEDYKVEFSSLIESTAKVNIVPDSLHIYQGTKDISDCYSITFEEKDITITSQPLSLKFKDASKIYDGKEISADEYEVTSGELQYGDKIVIGDGISTSDIGPHINHHKVTVMNEDNIDVTERYNLSVQDSRIDISKIDLSCSTNTLNKVYDGKPFSDDEYKVTYDESLILPSHKLHYEFNHNYVDNFVPSGKVANTATIVILDNENNDVSEYYNITTAFGNLEITKRPIHITSSGYSAPYDNKEHTIDSYEIDSGALAEGDHIAPYDSLTVKNAGSWTYNPNYQIMKTVDEQEVDVTLSCYDLTKTSGNVSITKLNASLNFKSGHVYEYDAQYHPIYDLNDVEVNVPDGYKTNVSFVNEAQNNIRDYNASPYSLSRSDFNITILDDEDFDVTSNFNISTSFESALITKKSLSITTPDFSKDYDGLTVKSSIEYNSSFSDGVKTDGLLDGHSIKINSYSGVDSYKAGTGSIVCSYIVYDIGGENVSKNYDIHIDNGSWEINRIPLTLHTSSTSKTYDGNKKVPSVNLWYDAEQTVIANDVISYDPNDKVEAESKNVGIHAYTINPEKISIKKMGDDVTNCYEINVICDGTLEIFKKEVIIEENQSSKEIFYDGIDHGIDNTQDFNISGIVKGETITFTGDYQMFKDPGYHDYRINEYNSFDEIFAPKIIDADNEDSTNNYFFTYQNFDNKDGENYYKINIKQKHFRCESNSREKTYDATPLNPSADNSNISISFYDGAELDKGDKIVFTNDGGRPTTVADSEDPEKNSFKYTVKVLNSSNEDVTWKYVIDCYFGTLTINMCNIKIELGSTNGVYSSSNINASASEFEVTNNRDDLNTKGAYYKGTLPYNYVIKCSFSVPPGDTFMVGNYKCPVTITQYYKDTLEPDYDNIKVEYGTALTYTVKQRDLQITTAEVPDWPYDGKTPAPEKRSISRGKLQGVDKLYFGDEAWDKNKRYYESVQDKIEKGEYKNELGPYKILRGSVDVTSCYKISTVIGKIVIS